ncbi:hypothetical protein DFH27DRAFT_540694 [Peziza echinospora]|nr:hypothetical protein DFH27DRAFT_540694 [Peziza echinospora]
MAKTKPPTKSSQADRKKKSKSRSAPGDRTAENPFTPTEQPETIIATATALLRESCDPDRALKEVSRAIAAYPTNLPALELAGEINVEIGDIPTALEWFQKAVSYDPDGLHEDAGGSGPEKFLWLAQLCENGGLEAIGWFDRAVTVLRNWIGECESTGRKSEMLVERGLKGKLCSALCAMAELYMTDLCMEPNAEEMCEKLVTEALFAVPDSAEALQTLASVRISQSRPEDAQAALTRSYGLWKDLAPDSPQIPPYATRMAISRLLMETEMYEMAFDVLERLQEEDDQVVDLWYLGGWCLYLLGERRREEELKAGGDSTGKGKEKAVAPSKSLKMTDGEDDIESDDDDDEDEDDEEEDDWKTLWDASREWLNNCARLYQALDWEDDRLRGHAIELLGNINSVLGEEMEDEEGDADEDGGEDWVDADGDASDSEVVMEDS